MLNQGCVQATGDTAVHRKRKSPGMPARGRQQNMCGLSRLVMANGLRRYLVDRAQRGLYRNQGNVGHGSSPRLVPDICTRGRKPLCDVGHKVEKQRDFYGES
jgi:hypothetical protein